MTYPEFVEGKVVVFVYAPRKKTSKRWNRKQQPHVLPANSSPFEQKKNANTSPAPTLAVKTTAPDAQEIGKNITTADVTNKAAGSSSPNVIKTLLLNLKRDVELEIRLLEQHKKAKKKVAVLKEDCDSFLSIIKQALEDDAITHARFAEIKESVDGFLEPLKMARGVEVLEEEEEVVYSENWRKRGPSPDPLFAAIEKTKTAAVVEEEEAEDAEENLDDLELEESMIAALTEGQDEDDHIHNDEEEDIEILVGGDEYGEGDEDEDEDEEHGKGWDDDQIEEDWPNY
ncbi:hypothetical protein D6C76_07471 [Aureobasidium pullulans]|uniref:Uncharacterized protein n=1 Tax=Aureobasidium pullulans TaxID=5580 RepID=A0A4S8XQ75_AURPU|nr:hypothetical protein D6D22_06293 [Aureobasidium pullulans]THX22776.1 hypothetical protein D6D12_08909 [Aureobasidium pullulans]THX63489.1 hypothetical protein D6D11_01775 [Aureobasidium pullulans]TIA70597.1 hypothetical protein D6C76_07471 [Aureobasidium pullulans]